MPDEIQTNDELTDKINAALEAEPDNLEEQPSVPSTVNAPETTENPSEEVETPANPEVKTTNPSPEPVDYKQKFVDSQKEAILLNERNKIKEAQLEQLTKTDTPTDEAMRLVYPEWDDLNEVTKKALVKTEAQEMRQKNLEARQEEIMNRFKFDEDLITAIESNPKLSGKEAEFKRFAANPKNKGISAEVLAKAFLFDVSDEVQTPAPKSEALPTGSGGPRGDLTSKKISLEEAKVIRQTDNDRYMALVKAGQIDDDI